MRPIRSSTQVREHADHDGGERRDHARTIERPRPRHAETDGEGSLPRGRIGRDVPEVVRDEDRHGEESEDGPAPPGRGRHALVHHERGPARRHQPEEEEDHHLAEAEPRVRTRPAAVRERRHQRERAHDEDQDRLGHQRQREPGEAGGPDRDERGDEHGPRRGGARRDEPRRAEAARRVDASDPVEEVVRVVHAHLEAQRDDQGSHEPPRDERVRSRGADEHRHQSRAECPGARAGDPDVHGRFGNLEKSGRRFST